MTGCVRVFSGVTIWRAVAAERHAALLARAQVNPFRSDLDALRALGNLGLSDRFDGSDVGTSRH